MNVRQTTIGLMCLVMRASAFTGPTTETTHHLRLEREHTFSVARPPAEAFRLFEPVGEKLWAEGWHPVFTSPSDAELHDGSVFTVECATPQGGTLTSVWMVSRYNPPHAIEYRNVFPGVRATQIVVRCEPVGTRQTRVVVHYVYHGLSESGDQFLATITPEAFRTNLNGWDTAIRAWLGRGTPATP